MASPPDALTLKFNGIARRDEPPVPVNWSGVTVTDHQGNAWRIKPSRDKGGLEIYLSDSETGATDLVVRPITGNGVTLTNQYFPKPGPDMSIQEP